MMAQEENREGVVRPAVVAELANTLLKKTDQFNKRLKKEPLNMTEVAAGLILYMQHIDTHRGGCVKDVVTNMLLEGLSQEAEGVEQQPDKAPED